jgi:hypothetical protein
VRIFAILLGGGDSACPLTLGLGAELTLTIERSGSASWS